jgi:hypothetical protein
MAYAICCEFKATNNEAEYEALLVGLKTAIDLKVKHIEVNCDSLLIVNHVNGSYKAKDAKMATYLKHVKELQGEFDSFTIRQVPREMNVQADALAGLGSVCRHVDVPNVPIIHVLKPAIDTSMEAQGVMSLQDNIDEESRPAPTWIQDYRNYLLNGTQPSDRNEARVFRMKASRYTVIDNVLFKKSVTGLLQRCLDNKEAEHVLRDLHEGECGNHTGGRNLSLKVLRMGYYWPTVKKDVVDYVRKCDACQRHAPVIHQPSEQMHPSIPSWPFMKWGMDIVGKMPPAPGQKVFMLAMMDYFSKWIEAEAF